MLKEKDPPKTPKNDLQYAASGHSAYGKNRGWQVGLLYSIYNHVANLATVTGFSPPSVYFKCTPNIQFVRKKKPKFIFCYNYDPFLFVHCLDCIKLVTRWH